MENEKPKRGIGRVIDESGNPIIPDRKPPEDSKEQADGTTEDMEESKAGPDWSDATAVLTWYGSEIVRLIHLARRKEALQRLRVLSSALDTWSRLARLSADTAEIQTIREELAALKREIESERGLRAVK